MSDPRSLIGCLGGHYCRTLGLALALVSSAVAGQVAESVRQQPSPTARRDGEVDSVARVSAKPITGQKWADMDYGPFLSASIEAAGPGTNLAFKGIAIKLAAAFGGGQNEAVVFDTDLLRYAAGWTGNYIALKGVVFDGEHWAYPRIDGDQVFGNRNVPGWAHAGNFVDPRPFIYGPLPREWGHWRGLFLYGDKVVLSYTVGDAEVLELPGLEVRGGLTAFVRNLDVGRSSRDKILQVAQEPAASVRLLRVDTLAGAVTNTPAGQVILCLAEPAKASSTGTLALAAVGTPAGARWIATSDGHARLYLPAAATPARFKVLIARLPEGALPALANLVKQSGPAPALEPYTHGGPPRWSPGLVTRGQLGTEEGPYAIDTITWPEENPWHSWMRFGGFDFFKDSSRAAICTWSGDVWIVSGLEGNFANLTWRRFATGLYQPLGLKIVADEVYVLGRDQITRLHDLNHDGEADWYENFNNDTMNTEHFHEFALDLQTDAAGNFYYMKGGRHARDALHPQHGTLIKVAKDGFRSEILAKGFRAPNGLAIGPQGEFYSTDQEGFWMPANRLNLIRPGGFYGNKWSWFPEGKPTQYDPPICWIHPHVDRSPSTMNWVTSDRWGPMQNGLLSFSYGVGRIFHVLFEEVDGVVQGGITPMPVEFDTGLMRSRFHPRDGQLYVCGLYGWASNKTKPGGFFRVRYTGKRLYQPCALHVATNGVVLTFTEPLDQASATDPGNYSVEVWNYRWTENYGSPDFKLNGEKGHDRLVVESAQLSRDQRSLFLKLPGICPVMQMDIQMNVRGADGTPIQTFVHNTIHVLGRRSGQELLGPPLAVTAARTRLELESEAPGLVQTVVSASGDTKGKSDTRLARLVALRVPAASPPTPFLPPGPFLATWKGFLKLELSDGFRFRAAGAGKVSIQINGRVVIEEADLSEAGVSSALVPLRGGLNHFRVAYESPPTGDASLRLSWFKDRLPTETLPPTAFVHEASDAALRVGDQRRLGRQLFATRHCLKCHRASSALSGDDGMPELAAEAPDLANAGARLDPAWVKRWIERPASFVPDTAMPECLAGAGAEVASQAGDLAAFLATLGQRPHLSFASTLAHPERGATNEVDGELLYSKLGCFACHWFPGEKLLAGDKRLPLGHTAAKWRPGALTEYLRSPAKTFPWTRMPDFQLTESEASGLAAFLVRRTAPAAGSRETAPAGDAQRGQRLFRDAGCANCHQLEGVSSTLVATSLEHLVGKTWNTGCLASPGVKRGAAPDFRFSSGERQALANFLMRDAWSLRQRDWTEFAERQMVALRCSGCHARDGAQDQWSILAPVPAGQPTANPYDGDDQPAKSIHGSRPPLTWTGEKLRPEWTEQLLLGKLAYKPRPKLEARMPVFAASAHGLAAGLALEHGLDTVSPRDRPVDVDQAEIGRALVRKGALSCVDCHAIGAQAALAGADMATINFVYVSQRLRNEYYQRYVRDPLRLLPGTMMPKFIDAQGRTGVTAYYRGAGDQQFEAIWQYLRSLAETPFAKRSATESAAPQPRPTRATNAAPRRLRKRRP